MRTLTTSESADVAGGHGCCGCGGFPLGLGTGTITSAGGVTTITAGGTATLWGQLGGGTGTITYAGGVLTVTGTYTGPLFGGFGGFPRP